MTTKKHSKRRRNFENIIRTLIDQIEQSYLDTPFDNTGNDDGAYDPGYRIPGFKILPETSKELDRAVAHLEAVRNILKGTQRVEHVRYNRFIRENRPGVRVRQARGAAVLAPGASV